MTPLVIPLHHKGGKHGDNAELRLTLRSIAMNLKGDYKVFILSRELPEWVTGVELIPDGGKGLKTAIALAAEKFPDGFNWWYDDCCLTRLAIVQELKITPACQCWSKATTSWATNLESIRQRLIKEGHEPWDYSRPHGPYWFDKGMIDEAFADWPGMAGKFPFETWILSKRKWPRRHSAVRQYYGAFRTKPGKNQMFVNWCDNGFTDGLRKYLESVFPEPCKYEKVVPRIEIQSRVDRALSFSLYGEKSVYPAVLIDNVTLAGKHYPGWDVVVHAETGHYAIPRLKDAGARVVEHAKEPGNCGMRWRFDPLDYDILCVRDADSRLNPREKAAVDEWLASGKSLHVMRDHRMHRKVIMAGMWGIRGLGVDLLRRVEAPCGPRYGDDERWLAENVWPSLNHDALIHDRNFPEHEPWAGFVGGYEKPVLRGKGRVVVLSAPHYKRRREAFTDSMKKHGGFLNTLEFEMRIGTPAEQAYCPPSFRKLRRKRHWWVATCDHITILRESLLRNDDWLFVFEDDMRFKPEFEERFWRAWCALPAGWKGMRLHWNRRFDGLNGPVIAPGVLDRACKDGQGMAGMFWDKSGIYRFYDHYHHRMRMLIDEAFEDLRRMEPGDWYAPAIKLMDVGPDCRQGGRDS